MILIITKPVFFAGEGERIGDMLIGDEADKIHIRKPGASMSEMERLLQSIHSELYPRLVMHDCFRLAVSYGVGGHSPEQEKHSAAMRMGRAGEHIVSFVGRTGGVQEEILRLHEPQSDIRQHKQERIPLNVHKGAAHGSTTKGNNRPQGDGTGRSDLCQGGGSDGNGLRWSNDTR